MPFRAQRVRDPLHNIIEFKANEFENAMWETLQTRPFQRLRRVKQLGFSELVYPGATHTRFAHSIGVFHTARLLMSIIQAQLGATRFHQTRADRALAAALVHDVGHGPFSHAFEDVGGRLGLKLATHEKMSDTLIRASDMRKALDELGNGFADDVADIISADGPRNIYGAVVSSQFDADRLDYMRRDRLMTGTHHGAIDFDWLLANLQVGEVPVGVEEAKLPDVETFVLGPKATYAAETYVVGLFHLYPTVYFHKATRGAEKLFTELLLHVMRDVIDGHVARTGLWDAHPIARFAREPKSVDRFLALDDAVVWGALPMMAEATNPVISEFASRLSGRHLFKCIDVREELQRRNPEKWGDSDALDRACASVTERIKAWIAEKASGSPRILLDQASRPPYKRLQADKGPLNQIMIKHESRNLVDVGTLSKVVSAVETFRLFRVYAAREDTDAHACIEDAIGSEARHAAAA